MRARSGIGGLGVAGGGESADPDASAGTKTGGSRRIWNASRTRRRVLLSVVAAVASLAAAGASIASAEDPSSPQASHADWPLAPGRFELGAVLGGGFNIDRQPEPVTLLPVFLRAGYVFLQQEALVPGSLEIVAEPGYLAVFEGKTANVGSLVAQLKYNIRTGTRLVPFVEGGGGVSYASQRIPQQPGGTHFNFVVEAGVGLHYLLGDRTGLTAEWRFHHFSNGGIEPPNPSLNSSLFLVGFSVFR